MNNMSVFVKGSSKFKVTNYNVTNKKNVFGEL